MKSMQDMCEKVPCFL